MPAKLKLLQNEDMAKDINQLYTLQLRGYCSKNGYLRLQQVLAMARTLYNAALQERRDAYRHSRKQISYKDQQNQLTLIKQDLPEFTAVDNRVWRATLWKLDKSFKAFFRRVATGESPGYPRFKGRNRYRTIELVAIHPGMLKSSPDGRRAWVSIKGLPAIEVRPKRPLPDRESLQTIRITMRPTGVTVDLVYHHEPSKQALSGKPTVGIDLGVNQRLTLSDGTVIEPRQVDRARVESLQRRLSTARKGSNRRRKRAAALSRECRRNQVRNRNQCHQITTSLVKDHSLIAIEDLNLRNMTASARGTVETPGSQVKQKAGLNRSLLEQSLGLITNQLRYKAEWAGVQLIAVNPRYTSMTCSACGSLNQGRPDEYRVFRCAQCGLTMDRDHNATINILNRALRAQQGGNSPAAPSGAMITAGPIHLGSSCM